LATTYRPASPFHLLGTDDPVGTTLITIGMFGTPLDLVNPPFAWDLRTSFDCDHHDIIEPLNGPGDDSICSSGSIFARRVHPGWFLSKLGRVARQLKSVEAFFTGNI
jgi:hypothetical protein